ncbi:hypothetical protein LJR175_004250 [Variovorax sp. LjRoot175]|uniref:ankyrin repeat domain-containing protein n=1 Tax=Variovorax sp. LjRoot175 TaxID=3342276 RepID=UPI003ECF81C3
MDAPQIYNAATFGDMGLVTALLDADPLLVNARDQYGFTPLHGVVGEDNIEMARCLISRGAEVGGRFQV